LLPHAPCSLYERNPFPDELESDEKKVWGIHGENLNRRAPDGCCSRDAGPFELKMAVPDIGPRVKQANQFVRPWIESRDIGSLELKRLQ
jgi:hypothetical protein